MDLSACKTYDLRTFICLDLIHLLPLFVSSTGDRTQHTILETANQELEDLAQLNNEEKAQMACEIAELHAENTRLLDERPVMYTFYLCVCVFSLTHILSVPTPVCGAPLLIRCT